MNDELLTEAMRAYGRAIAVADPIRLRLWDGRGPPAAAQGGGRPDRPPGRARRPDGGGTARPRRDRVRRPRLHGRDPRAHGRRGPAAAEPRGPGGPPLPGPRG